jgi:hypothetical protein
MLGIAGRKRAKVLPFSLRYRPLSHSGLDIDEKGFYGDEPFGDDDRNVTPDVHLTILVGSGDLNTCVSEAFFEWYTEDIGFLGCGCQGMSLAEISKDWDWESM